MLRSDELDAYLDRVGLPTADVSSRAGLAQLHVAHLLAVPFESLDIHLGVPIAMDTDAVVDKLVHRRRGGFCYENNILLAAVLATLGLDVVRLSAEVARPDHTFGAPFDHLVLRTDAFDPPLLLDVGFGEGFRSPLPVDGAWHEQTPSLPHRARREGDWILVEQRRADGETAISYRVDPTPREAHEFHEMCTYHQTSPDSGFTRAWVASRATAEGRITVTPWRLIDTSEQGRTERELESIEDLAAVLAQHLGIVGLDLAPLGHPT